MKHNFYIYFLLVFLLCSCSGNQGKKYIIGVSQTSVDNWREQLNREMKTIEYFDPNVEVHIVSAEDDSQKQSDQINMLIDEGIDLLVVAPNQYDSLIEPISRAYDNKIPVILFDRKINSEKYTAFIGADNYNIGYSIGEYMSHRLNGHGNVVELKGLANSSPTMERHQGFLDAITRYPGIHLIASEYADWKGDKATKVMDSILNTRTDIDYVYGQNDIMAHAAYKVVKKRGIKRPILYSGVDALNTPGGGLELVHKGELSATCTYPTQGDKVMELAMKILRGEKYDHVNKLKTTVITPTNVGMMQQLAKEIERQDGNLELLYDQIDKYLQEYKQQQFINLVSFAFAVFMLVLTCVLYVANRRKARKNKELQDRIIRLTRK